ncbi:hypothetical protein [uncultured Brevibacillus sp.]|uniref:hypothetical protein n=1 Tax=uncultured Brevibacillus sp. TaxID=169970 RepID=UPI002599C2E0|nr:hypothetical protein [uncultured Brevibacillus sp.]
MFFTRKVKSIAVTSLSVLTLVMPFDAVLAKGGTESTTSNAEQIQLLMSEKYLWSEPFNANNYDRINRNITLQLKERAIYIEADATGGRSSYEIAIEEFDTDLEGWTPVETHKFTQGRDSAYFYNLDQAVQYRVAIHGRAKGTVSVYKVVD